MSTITFSRPAEEFERLCTNHLDLDTPPNGITLTSDLCRIAVTPVEPPQPESVPATTIRSYGFIGGSVGYWDFGWPANAIYNGQRCWGRWDSFAYDTIDSADLVLHVSAITGVPVGTYTIYGVKALSHSDPMSYAGVNSLTKTTASVSVNTSGMTAGTDVTVGVTAILQEIIGQSGWVPGTNNLGLVAIESGVTNGNFARLVPISFNVVGTVP